MNSPLTLHDFVINLLSDADARAAFQLDPDGALSDAGLGDVTASDVQDIIPLVADYAPAHVAALDSGLPEFATSTLGADRLGAIHQLQYVTAQLPLAAPANDLTVAAAGTLSGVTSGVTGLAGGLPAFAAPHLSGGADFSGGGSISGGPDGASLSGGGYGDGSLAGVHASGGAGLCGDFSPAHDLTGTLDAGLGDATSGLTGTLDAGTASLTGTVHGALGGTLGDLTGSGDGFGHAGLAGLGGVGDLTGTATSGLTGLLSNPLDATHAVDPGGLTGGVTNAVPGLDSATGLLHGSGPLGSTGGADASGTGHTDTGTHLLDVTHLL